MDQEAVNNVLEASEGNIYKYVEKIRGRLKLYFFLLVISVLCNVALIFAWHMAIQIAQTCITRIN